MPHESGFSPKIRAQRLLRQSAGLMPPSDVQNPAGARTPIIAALLNLQLGAGLIGTKKAHTALGGTLEAAPAATAGRQPPISPFATAFQRRSPQAREQALARRRPDRRTTRASINALGGGLF